MAALQPDQLEIVGVRDDRADRGIHSYRLAAKLPAKGISQAQQGVINKTRQMCLRAFTPSRRFFYFSAPKITIMTAEEPSKRQIVLCFDGTGNTFRVDGTDTNILKIYRMLEKSDNTRESLGSIAYSVTVSRLADMQYSILLSTYDWPTCYFNTLEANLLGICSGYWNRDHSGFAGKHDAET
jgi:hypothetical protein